MFEPIVQQKNNPGIRKNPKVLPVLTVVMPVYNGEKYLREAIDSVLNQSFTDFEFLIINDGSTDGSKDIINSYTDYRIRLINNERNCGVAFSRNIGLREAKGEFLTWSDCDDINYIMRFKNQIEFLRRNNEIGICGTELFRFGGAKSYTFKVDTDPQVVKATLLFRPSIPNATAMLRLSFIKKHKLYYNNDLPIAEDYDFILRCSMCFPITNISKVLYKYRDSETSLMKKYNSKEDAYFNIHNAIYSFGLGNFGIIPSSSDLRIHGLIASEKLYDNIKDYKDGFKWLKNIKSLNHNKNLYSTKALNKVLGEEFFFISKKASSLGVKIFIFYIVGSYKQFHYVSLFRISKLFVRCAIKYKKF